MPSLATDPGDQPSFSPAGLRVALVHDWLTGMRGGEKVLESICRMFPSADLLTLVHVPGSVSPLIEGRRVRRSFVQHFPRPARFYRHYLPAFPTAVECFDLDDVDLVVSTSHCAAKSVVPTGRAVHVCYCHSPMRYAWDQFDAYFGEARIGAVANALARPVMAWLARWDRGTAGRVDSYVANSGFVAARIRRYYNREASVVYPPVDTGFFTPAGPSAPYFLVVSALVPYKRLEVAIEAAGRLGAPLKIVGGGPDFLRLRALAGPTVEFMGSVNDQTLRDLYRGARALVLPAEEDFGIAPVEAMACGRPVVALARGGATETVIDGYTGRLVAEATAEAFADAMHDVASRDFQAAAIASHAASFSIGRFESEFAGAVSQALATTAAC